MKLFNLVIIFLILFLILLVIICKKKEEHFKTHNYEKIIWMYWEQGESNLNNNYNKMCIEGWRKLNPDWKIKVLDKSSSLQYVPEMKKYDWVTVQIRSDILRTKLLLKYGGVWADASTLPLKSLTGNIDNIDNNQDIFFYRYIPNRPYYISSWFIIAKRKNHYLLKKLDKEFVNILLLNKKNKKKNEYFIYHNTLTKMYNNDAKIKNIIDNLSITQDLRHAPKRKKKYPELNIKNIHKLPLMFKRAKIINKNVYFKYLNSLIHK